MTVIAWDGHTLAADRQSGDQWTKFGRMTKIRLLRGHLVGAAGNSAQCRTMMKWFADGARAADFPASQRTEASATMLVITPRGVVHLYESTPDPIEFGGSYYAIGCGKEAAAAVLELGLGSLEAVRIASIVCAGCGGGIDTLQLASGRRTAPLSLAPL